MRVPIQLKNRPMVAIGPTPMIGQDSVEFLEKYIKNIDGKDHVIAYPAEEPLLKWLWNFVVWGIYAIKAGNI